MDERVKASRLGGSVLAAGGTYGRWNRGRSWLEGRDEAGRAGTARRRRRASWSGCGQGDRMALTAAGVLETRRQMGQGE
eukprot:6207317-Pleurochrysis_carterae.AAC.3